MIQNIGPRNTINYPKPASQPSIQIQEAAKDDTSAVILTDSSAETNFYSVFTDALDAVRGNFADAKEATTDALVGQGTPHNAMLAMAKADLTFRFMTQTRNKVVDAYREFMNMRM